MEWRLLVYPIASELSRGMGNCHAGMQCGAAPGRRRDAAASAGRDGSGPREER